MNRLDYILEIIKATIQAIVRAKSQRRAGNFEQALKTLNGSSEQLTGISVDGACAMPLASLVDLLGGVDMDPQRALAMAEIIKETGHAYEAHKNTVAKANTCYIKAFCLYDEVTRLAPGAPELIGHESVMPRRVVYERPSSSVLIT